MGNEGREKHCLLLDKPLKVVSSELMERFVSKTWEGNVRELENVIRQGILFSSTDEIKPADVDLDSRQNNASPAHVIDGDLPYRAAKEEILKTFNHSYIGRLLELTGGNISRAARICGLERQALQQIMRRYQINANDYRA